MKCNVVAKKEASLRKSLKITILLCKPDDNGLLVCTIYFRTEEVLALLSILVRFHHWLSPEAAAAEALEAEYAEAAAAAEL